MSLIERIQGSFYASIEIKKAAAEKLPESIFAAGELMAERINKGNKILSCGNGGSACDAQHFASEMVNRFQIERDNLAAIALTTDTATITSIANDYSFEEIFAKQIKAIGHDGDILLAITTTGASKNVIKAVQVAHEKKMRVIALTGGDGGMVSTIINDKDIEIRVPAEVTARVQEVHILIIHCLCDVIEQRLFGIGE